MMKTIFLLVIFGAVVVAYYVLSMKTVLRKIRENELYVAEAIYEGSSGKPYRVYLSGYKKAYGGYGLQMAEKFKPGDKVIVFEKPGVVYKARG